VAASERKIVDPRWRDEHSQIVNTSDLPRFAKLGVIPSMQPSHAIGDLFFAPRRLGVERLRGANAWQSLIKSGVVIPAGSDAPVERGEPMIEFYAAVARKPLPSRAAGAYVAFEEDLKGSISFGKLADFTVLSADIMEVPELEILNTKNLMTIIGGQIVYEAK
jgi:predicted amidohydrolase YtcJ